MSQSEVEILPIVLGFTIGTLIFIVQRIFPSQPLHSYGDNKKELPDGEEEEFSLPLEEPAAEPPTELTPDEPGTEPKSAAQEVTHLWSRVTRLAVLGVAMVLVTCVLPEGGLKSSAIEAPPAVGGTAKEVLSVLPTQPPGPEVPTPTSPGVTVSDQQELSARTGTGATLERAATHEHVLGGNAHVVPVVESPAGVDGNTPEDSANSGKLITLNLTRQQMAVRMIDNVMHYKSAYWGTLTVGTPAVDFKVVFDTGSGHLILPSTFCHSETCRAHKRYRRSKSTSAKDIDYDGTLVKPGDARDQITVSFGTGEVTGVFVEEVVCLDSIKAAFMPQRSAHTWSSCMPLRMIIATEMSEEPFKTFHFDGVLGLGLGGLSQAPEFNFLHVVADYVREWGGRRPHMFAVFLAEHEHEGSEITLGGYARERLEGELIWNPVLEPQHGHWMLRIKSVRIEDEVLNFCTDGCRAVVDTGTSLLAVPTPAFPEIFELLRHEADPLLECNGEGPKLHIELEHFTVTLEPHDYARLEDELPHSNVSRRESLPMFPLGPHQPILEQEAQMCKPMLMSMSLPAPIGPKLFVLGEPVLRKYYTVYDSDEVAPRIAFARAWHGASNLPHEAMTVAGDDVL